VKNTYKTKHGNPEGLALYSFQGLAMIRKKIEKLFQKHFEKLAPKSVKVKVSAHHGGYPVVVPTNSIEYKAAEKAMEQAYGKKPLPQGYRQRQPGWKLAEDNSRNGHRHPADCHLTFGADVEQPRAKRPRDSEPSKNQRSRIKERVTDGRLRTK
jgi:hypothetical protein